MKAVLDRFLGCQNEFFIHTMIRENNAGVETKLKALLKKKAHLRGAYSRYGLDTTEVVYNETPLLIAASKGNVEIVKLLLSYGADPKMGNSRRETALHIASRRGHVNCVEALCDYGETLKCRDSWDQTPLHCAAKSGNADVVEVLLRRGASPKAENMYKQTPLHLAVPRHPKCIRALMMGGATVDAVDDRGQTPLYISVYYAEMESVKELLRWDVPVDEFIQSSRTKPHAIYHPMMHSVLTKWAQNR